MDLTDDLGNSLRNLDDSQILLPSTTKYEYTSLSPRRSFDSFDDSYTPLSKRNSATTITIQHPDSIQDPYMTDIKDRMKQKLGTENKIDFNVPYNDEKLTSFLKDRQEQILSQKPAWYKIWKSPKFKEEKLKAMIINFLNDNKDLDTSLSDSDRADLMRRISQQP